MADNISNIIDPQVFTDVDKLIASIKEVENEITIINGKALSVNVDIKGADSLNALSAAMEKQQVLLDGLQETYKNNVAVTKEVNVASKNLGVTIGATANDIGNLENRLAGLNVLLSQSTKGSEGYRNLQTQIAKTSSELDMMKPKIQQVNTELGTTNIQVNKVSNSFTVLGVNIESVFARMAIRMVAMQLLFLPLIAGVTMLWEAITKLSDAEQELKNRTDALKDSQQEWLSTMQEAAAKATGEINKNAMALNNLLDVYNKSAEGSDMQIKSYIALADVYGKVLQPLSDVEIKTKKISDAHKEGMSTLNKYNEAKQNEISLIDKYNSTQDALTKNRAAIADFEEHATENNKRALRLLEDGTYTRGQMSRHFGGSDIIAQFDAKANASAQQAYLDSPIIKKQIEDATKKRMGLEVLPEKRNPKTAHNAKALPEMGDTTDIDDQISKTKELADNQKAIMDDKTKGLEESLQANLKYAAALTKIVELEKERQVIELKNKQINNETRISEIRQGVSEGKITPASGQINIDQLKKDNEIFQTQIEDRSAVVQKENKIQIQSGQDVLTQYKKVQDQQLEAQKEALTAELSAIEDKAIQEEEINKAAYDKGEITAEEHNRRLKKIKKQAEDDETATALKHYQEMLLTVDLGNGVGEHINEQIRQLKKKQLGEVDTTSKKEQPSGAMPELEAGVDTSKESASLFEGGQLQKNLTEVRDFTNQALETYTSFYDAIKQMRDNAFAAEQQQLEIKMKAVTLAAQQQQAAILGTTNFQITKENQLAVLAAQTAAKQNDIQAQENALALKKAKADKTSAEMTVILNTAKGISATFPLWATDPAEAAIEVAIITALGVAQYAAAASTPLPQFFTGGTTSTPYFIAGEKGRELMTFPSGEQRIADKPGIYNAPIGTKIDPNHITEMMINNASSTLGMSVYDMYKFKGSDMTDERIVKKLDDVENTLVDIHRSGNRAHQTIIKVESNNNLAWKIK